MLIIDQLIQSIQDKNNPSVVGIDTDFAYLDPKVQASCQNTKDKCSAILAFNRQIIDSICDIVPAVKVQIAYYEIFGSLGLDVFAETVRYSKQKGLITINDAKRGDIGATANMYAKAFLEPNAPFECDFLTVNAYFGTDGLQPFVDLCKQNNKGLFVLVKTSNPSGAELQNLVITDLISNTSQTVYQKMATMCQTLGKDIIGQNGYSNIGAVVGCTHSAEAIDIRKQYPNLYMLVPGYGTQGGSAEDAKLCFDKQGNGAIVNSSRGILLAHKNPKYAGLNIFQAARQAAIDMREELKIQ